MIQVFTMRGCELLQYHILYRFKVGALVLHETGQKRDQSSLFSFFDIDFLDHISKPLDQAIEFEC